MPDKNDRDRSREDREITDRNANGIDDAIEPPRVDVGAGSHELAERLRQHHSTDPQLSGGDVDARWEDAESSGEETAAGSAPTPDQDSVDEIGGAMGVTYASDEELKAGSKERSRDKKRWELDPASSEDYKDRAKDGKK